MKKKTEMGINIDAIRDLIRNLGHISKLLIEFIPIMEGLMKTEKDLQASLDALVESVAALTNAVTNLPPPLDLSTDVSTVDSLKTKVDAATASLTPIEQPVQKGPPSALPPSTVPTP